MAQARRSQNAGPDLGINPDRPVTIRLPEMHEHQSIFIDWCETYPDAQVLVAPCGVKLGKSFGAAAWLLKEALANPGFYCIWVAPTMYKAKVGYRYVKAMLPDIPLVRPVDGALEIHLSNGSFIKFLHGRDAETTVEGDAIDAFVIDEAGKQSRQLWLSTFTTITQTQGKGIITGTPRGHTWYHEIFKLAVSGDKFFCYCQLATWLSPYVTEHAVSTAKRLLPKNLFDQYYRAQFVSFSTVFGDLDSIWDDEYEVEANRSIWIHPNNDQRALDACTGVDWAKVNDYTVFNTVNSEGRLIGYCRFRGGPYTQQVMRLKAYLKRFSGDMALDYDKTGVGLAIEDIISEAEIDASINGVTFTNSSKQEMVTRASIAFSEGWFKSPRIHRIETELTALEVEVSKSGQYCYSAPDGEHDDVAWSLMLAINGAYSSARADSIEQMIATSMGDMVRKKNDNQDTITEYADIAGGDDIDDPDTDDWANDDFDDNELDG